MMSWYGATARVCIVAMLTTLGCGSGEVVTKDRLKAMAGGTLKDVVSVSGKVLVNGQPASGVLLQVYSSNGDKPLKSVIASSDGKYCWSTYTPCDGLEPGGYKLTFKHLKNPKKEKSEDLFKGLFSDLSTTKYELTVEAGKPQVNVDYDLKTN